MVDDATLETVRTGIDRARTRFVNNARIGLLNSTGQYELVSGDTERQVITVTLDDGDIVKANRGTTPPVAGEPVTVNKRNGQYYIEGVATLPTHSDAPRALATVDAHSHNKGYLWFTPIDAGSLLDGGMDIVAGTTTITLKRKLYYDDSGDIQVYAGGDTLDLDDYRSGISGGEQRWAIVYVNRSTGAIGVYEPTPVSAPANTTTHLSIAITACIDNVSGAYPYLAMRINTGSINLTKYKPASGYDLSTKDFIRFDISPNNIESLVSLTDTDITSPTNRQVPVYNSSSSVWINDELNVGDLGDVGTASPLLGRALVGDGTEYNSYHMYIATPNDPTSADDNADGHREGSIWVNISTDKAFICTSDQTSAAVWQPLGATELSELTDADVTSPSDDDALMYDSVDGRFKNRPLAADDIKSGTLAHERGGLEADVSAYGGIPLVSGGSTSEIKYNLTATSDPSATDDSGSGYAVGSLWVNTSKDRTWQCVDNTASAAVWALIGGRVACIATRDSNYSLANNTIAAIPLNSETLDTDDMHDNSTNNTRITVPFDGLYQVSGAIRYTPSSTNIRDIRFEVNGGGVYLSWTRQDASSISDSALTNSALMDLSAGDYVELIGFQNSGSALDVRLDVKFQVVMVTGEGS